MAKRSGKPTGNPTGHPNCRLTVEQRFEMKVDRTGECHRWTGARNSDGYGHFWFEGRMRGAHIVALLLAGVEIPDGMTVDHVWARGCRHKDCVRVDHLEVVTNRENILRSDNPAALNARKQVCYRGHELIFRRNAKARQIRVCRQCEIERDQKRRKGAA